MRKQLANYDFTWISNMDTRWSKQKSISKDKTMAMLACLLHYNLDVSLFMRYLGSNYVAEHRDVERKTLYNTTFASCQLVAPTS